jgi:hypothetical protein
MLERRQELHSKRVEVKGVTIFEQIKERLCERNGRRGQLFDNHNPERLEQQAHCSARGL